MSFPIIWGAQILENLLLPIDSSIKGEMGVNDTILLGDKEGVTVAFSHKKDKEKLKQWIEERNLNIVPRTMGSLHIAALIQRYHV